MEILIGALAATTLLLLAGGVAYFLWQRRAPQGLSPDDERLDALAATAATLATAQADLGGRLTQMSEQSAVERAELLRNL